MTVFTRNRKDRFITKQVGIIILLLLGFAQTLCAQTLNVDSIKTLLSTMPDTARISYLDAKMLENEQNALRLDYAHLLFAEAKKQKDDYYLANAMYMLARHFYVTDVDSMRYWIKECEPLFLKLERKEDLCRMKAWDIYQMNREGKWEQVIEAVNALEEFSTRIDFPEGIEMAEQALADFYFTTNQFEEGEQICLRVLEKMDKRNAPLIKKFNVARNIYNIAPTSEKRLFYLKLSEQLLEQNKKEQQAGLQDYPLHSQEYVVHRNYANEYSLIGDPELTYYHLMKADSISRKYNMVRAKREIDELYSKYYWLTDDYEKALIYIESAVTFYRERNMAPYLYKVLDMKAQLLNLLDRDTEAYELSRELLIIKDSINHEDFQKFLAKTKTEYEVERLELDKQRAEQQAKQASMQLTWVLIGCFVLLLIIVALGYLIRIILSSRKQLKLAKEKAEEADQMKSAFFANMNHEIRTPLNAIVGFSQVLVDEEDRESREQFAEIIQNNNELLQRLIADVLDISKLESNSMSLFFSEEELPGIMKEIYSMLQMRMQPGVVLYLDPCLSLTIDTDRNRLMQVLTNLLTNAIKHTRQGHIRFGYRTEGEEVLFYVEDTGEGISINQQESIFDRFVQLESGRKGVGLGLAICKGLTTKMNGTIWVESELGKGSTFYVRIPIKQKKT